MPVVLPGRSPFIKPPPGAVPIVGHPLCNRLRAGLLLNSLDGADVMRALVLERGPSASSASIVGRPRLVQGFFGSQALFLDGSTVTAGMMNGGPPLGAALNGGRPTSLAVWFAPFAPTPTTRADVFGIGQLSTTTGSRSIGISGGNPPAAIGAGSSASLIVGSSIPLNSLAFAAWSGIRACGPSGSCFFFCNGRVYPDGTTNSALNASDRYVGFGNIGNGAFTGIVEAAFLWDRMLTVEDCNLLYTQPFCFLRHPSQIRYFFPATATVATSYTLSGPSSGTVNVASTNFTVTPVGGAATATVTPASNGAGTFTPSAVTFSGSGAKTFTYTPTSTVGSPHTISVTNNGGLTNPGNLSYTVNPAATGFLLKRRRMAMGVAA